MWLGFHSFLWLVGSAAVWLIFSAPRPEVLPRRLGVHLEGTWWQAGNVGEQWWQPRHRWCLFPMVFMVFGCIWVCFSLVSSDTTSSIRSSLIVNTFDEIRRSITFVSNFLHFFILFDILWWVFLQCFTVFQISSQSLPPLIKNGEHLLHAQAASGNQGCAWRSEIDSDMILTWSQKHPTMVVSLGCFQIFYMGNC